MIVRPVLLSIVTIIFSLGTAAARAEVIARVAVLPFEVYTNASAASLKNTIANELSSHLAQEEGIAVVDQARIKDILDSKTSFSFNEAALRSIAEKLEVPFLVLGSMTQIGENLSLDTYLFTTQGSSSFSKDFTEGKNLTSLIKIMAQKISSRMLVAARAASAGQEPEAAEIPSFREPDEPAGEAPAGEDNPPVPEEQVNPEVLKDPAGSVVEDGDTATAAELPKGDADRSSEQPHTSDKKKRKGTSLSSPFSTMKPIQITSKSMEADNKKSMVTFTGNVVVKQEDIVILSDIMKVSYEAKGGISRVEASGNVKMSQENRIATGRKLVFYNPEQKIVMTGNAKIWQGDNLISCEKVTVLLEEDKIFFEGTVDSIIYPKSIQAQDTEKTQQVEPLPLPPQDPASENEVREENAIPHGEGEDALKDASH